MAELVVFADPDAYMDESLPTFQFGSADLITTEIIISNDKTTWSRAIGNFDCSALANFTINAAKLRREIFAVTNGGFQARISRCTRRRTWTESHVTWNNYKSGTPWTAGGGDFDDTGPPAKVDYTEASSTGQHEITGLLAFVTDAIDNQNNVVSLILRQVDEDPAETRSIRWRAKETGSDIWALVVDYDAPPVTTDRRRALIGQVIVLWLVALTVASLPLRIAADLTREGAFVMVGAIAARALTFLTSLAGTPWTM